MSRNNSFQFKQFRIIQERSAMKVGMDGVLIGSWTDVSNAERILDVGRQMNVKKAPAIISQVSEVVARWNQFADQTRVETQLRDAIGQTMLLL